MYLETMTPLSQSLVTKEEIDYESFIFRGEIKMVLPVGASLRRNFSKQHNIPVSHRKVSSTLAVLKSQAISL